jgi:hypothetical protein
MSDSNVTQTNADNSCGAPAADPYSTPPPPEDAPTPDANWTAEETPPPYEASYAELSAPPPEITPPPEMPPLPSVTPPPPDQSPDPTWTPTAVPPAMDSSKGDKTVDDYVSMGMPESPDTGARNVQYNLDKMGNRTSVTDNVYGNTSYTPSALNQYSVAAGYTVSNNNQHQIQSYRDVTYTYRNDEQLVRAQGGSNDYWMLYDALGRCVKRSLNTGNGYADKFYIYDGEKPILEYDGQNQALIGRNVYGKGVDEILMRTDYTFNPTAVFYYQHDHEGSVTHLTNASGTVIEKYRYDVFGAPTVYDGNGNLLPFGSACSNRFLFTGREYAAALGFYEYRARVYHSGLGRFRDIAGGITAVLQSLQRAGQLGSLAEFNGSFFFRMVRGSSSISAHAYGLAVDVNGSMNPRGFPSRQPSALRAAFTGAGFIDGGTWASPQTDAMHFSVGF